MRPIKNYIIKRHMNEFYFVIIMIFVVSLSALIRLQNITEIGVSGSDTFAYWHYAGLWSEGDHILRVDEDSETFYRPLSFFLYSLAAEWFDFKDYAIKYFNIIVDMSNIFLVFLIGRKMTNQWIGLLASLLYGLNPSMIHFARSEMLHILSIWFVLLAFYLLLLFIATTARTRLLLAGLSGMVLSLGVHVHTSVGFFLAGFAALIFFDAFLHGTGLVSGIKKFFVSFSIFMASFVGVVVMILPWFWSEFQGIRKSTLTIIVDRGGDAHSLTELMARLIAFPTIPYRFIKHKIMIHDFIINMSLWIVGLMVVILLVGIFRNQPWMDQKKNIYLIAPFVLMLGFVYSVILMVPGMTEARVYLPLIALFILHLCGNFYLPFKYGGVGIGLLSVIYMFNVMQNPDFLAVFKKTVSDYRILHDAIGGQVNANNTILFISNPVDNVKPESIKPYFGSNAVYYNNCQESLPSFIERHQVKYILIPDRPIHYTTNKGIVIPLPKWTPSCFEHTVDQENSKRPQVGASGWWSHRVLNQKWLDEILRQAKGEVIFHSSIGQIVMLNGKTPQERALAISNIIVQPPADLGGR